MIDKNTIMIIEDSEIDRKVLSHVLCSNYSIIEAKNGAEALELLKLRKDELSLIILDLMMPVMNGFEFLEKTKEIENFDIPVVVVTADENVENIYKALDLGAISILPKPYNTEKLLQKIKEAILNGEISHLTKKSLIEQSKTVNQRAKYQLDKLTGLYNQTGFLEVAREAMDKNPMKKYTIIRSDFTRFKLVNDMYNRETGDKLLKDFAIFLLQTLPSSSIIARWDSDKFITLVSSDREDLIFDIEKIDDFLKTYPLNINLNVLYGVYLVKDKSVSVDRMCDRADYAVKRAKNGFDSAAYVIYNDSLEKWIKIEQTVISGIDGAIKNGEIMIYYQPKYSLITQKIVGAEALVRWNHPKYGMISPAVFIPILENNGLIHQLDHYVWDQTCAAVARWRKTDLPKIPVSVNVSRNNFYREKLWIELLDLIEKHGLTPDCINIEITESS
ncbi:MAG: EAL domain-containing protein, partial [Sphaerochaetaceae bacterium]|nr:EAL domain-containing protein [Sphaerochaetaceae bacterium]